jgi:hypothetical protein
MKDVARERGHQATDLFERNTHESRLCSTPSEDVDKLD